MMTDRVLFSISGLDDPSGKPDRVSAFTSDMYEDLLSWLLDGSTLR